jgi:hypothetical protein
VRQHRTPTARDVAEGYVSFTAIGNDAL